MENKYVRVKFLEHGKPYEHAYTYRIEEPIEIGDIVIISDKDKGVVVKYDTNPHMIYGTVKKEYVDIR